jgi:DNA helicase-2/ATP-dependent DNA helicase PcrA
MFRPVSESERVTSAAGADPLLAPLNEPQREAVQHVDGPMLVLAGAGSGKTRVITHRVAWLVEREGVAPWRVLAVTFTNKAAGEMRERLEGLLGPAAADVHVSTFHSAGAAILRREAERAGRTRSFTIYDDSDQLALVRRALQECGVGERIKAQLVRHRIDHAKNHAQRPQDLVARETDFVGLGVKKAYFAYERLLRAADAVDFGDLLLKVVVLFRENPDVLERYRRRFQYVLVDEFQDTNPAQYELLRLLCPGGRADPQLEPPQSGIPAGLRPKANLCAVGDDDQSIYRWRGADVSNILAFERDYPGTRVVKLERNYRSDAGILDAAYQVIRKNERRKEKRLWTDRPRGAPLELAFAHDERGEATEIANRIRALSREGIPYSEMAVFYRVNAQSRVLEEAMRLSRVPYHIVRGRAFYDRAEIKDAASYLRLCVNPRSDADLERVINRPARGLGETTIERLRAFARERQTSLYGALAEPSLIPQVNAGAQRRLSAFRALLGELQDEASRAPSAHAAVEAMFERTGLVKAYAAEGSEEALEKAENLRELSGAALEFDRLRGEAGALPPAKPTEPRAGLPEEGPLQVSQTALEAFLEQISLVGDMDSEDASGRVALMTLHAAKGLEFDAVFLSGMEEGVFPHSRATQGEEHALADPEEMAEERRLCYVGITRARRRLCFSLARSRALFGDLQLNEPSRFLSDIPRELFGLPAPPAALGDGAEERPAPPPRPARGPVPAMGARVSHPKFGEGLVVGSSGFGMNATVTVRFPGEGEKRIVARFLTLVG